MEIKLQKKRNWFLHAAVFLVFTSVVILVVLITSYIPSRFGYSASTKLPRPSFAETNLHISAANSIHSIPKLAYLISGSKGDGDSLKRTLRALYHPRNQYAVHLDLEASAEERLDLLNYVKTEELFVRVGNVRVIARANLVTCRGPTMVSNTLHAASILLKEGGDWDWFINLSASDYPLVTQDGSAWMMLSRPFIEYCLWGWDNFPRIVLMYYANFLSSPEGYFHTVICSTDKFRNTTVNNDLHFISWDSPPKKHPQFLTVGDYQRMVESNSPFARKFGKSELVLDKIDSELLGVNAEGFSTGGWQTTEQTISIAEASEIMGNATVLKPGAGAGRLKKLINVLLTAQNFHKHCA